MIRSRAADVHLLRPSSGHAGRGFRRYCCVIGPCLALTVGLLPCAALAVEAHAQEPIGRGPILHGGPLLLPVPAPDPAKVEPALREPLRAARDELNALLAGASVPGTLSLARAYGELGELYHANHVYIPAEPCYRNAERLDPEQPRWPYDRGYLAELTGELDKALEAYRRALELDPENGSVGLRLALVYLDLNEPQRAAPLLQRQPALPDLQAAALYARGRLALALRDFPKAKIMLERALSLKPEASRIRYPLAMAYRQMGDVDQARYHLAHYGEGKLELRDAVVQRLDALVRGSRTHLHRAMDAVQVRDYETAAEAFAEALVLDPGNVDLRVSLARTLYLGGTTAEARRHLEDSVRRQVSHALANFMLGVLHEADGDREQAVARYRATLRSEPGHGGAHHYLGDVLMNDGEYEAAARHYALAVRAVPRNQTARHMEVMALLRARNGQRRALARLERAQQEHPGQALFRYLLARMLAASPQPDVRDGLRALDLARHLYTTMAIPEHAETLAMALAEIGSFDEAQRLQEEALLGALSAGRFDLLARLEDGLDRYRSGRPARTPLPDDDPLFKPPPLDPAKPFRDYPTRSPY